MSTAVLGSILTFLGIVITGLLALLAKRIEGKSTAATAQSESGAKLLTQAVTEWKGIADDARTAARAASEQATAADKRAQAADDKAQKALDELATERTHSRKQDCCIVVLRGAVSLWAAWGRQIHDDWPALRLAENPPATPEVPTIPD